MSERINTPVRAEYDNDVGPNDDGFWEFWRIIDADDNSFATCDSEESANQVVAALNSHARLREACEVALKRIEMLHVWSQGNAKALAVEVIQQLTAALENER